MKRILKIKPMRKKGKKVEVVLYGLGPIGAAVGRLVCSRKDLKLVGAVDIDPDKVGREVGAILGVRPIGLKVSADAKALLNKVKPDVVFHCAGSHLKTIEPQLAEIISAGAHVISSAEELSYAYLRGRAAAQRVDALARKNGVVVFGTGVNPGFVMDVLPLVMTFACRSVCRIEVLRIVNASTRRKPLQRKVGAGMKRADFEREVGAGRMGHVGLMESVALLARGAGLKVRRIEEEIKPVVATKPVRSRYFRVGRGEVKGIKHVARATNGRREVIRAELQMYLGAERPRDEVHIEGDPNLRLVIPGGTAGDVATPATLVNSVERVMAAEPGLRIAEELAMPRLGAE